MNAIGTQGGTAGVDAITEIVLAQGTVGTANMFGNVSPVNLNGMVFLDKDSNGRLNGDDAGLAGVVVSLVGTDDLGHAVNQATTTAGDGMYHFTELRPGTYQLTKTPPSAYGDGAIHTGSAGGLTGTNQITGIRLMPGQTDVGSTFAELASTFSGYVFNDNQHTGTLQPGDAPLAGVTVTLSDSMKYVIGTTVTAPDGSYHFTGLPAGNYTAIATIPSNGAQISSNRLEVRAGEATVASFPVEVVTEILATGTISGSVFIDLNDNGLRDPNESSLSGVVVTLTGTDSSGHSINQTTTTATDGTYSFGGLQAGTYAATDSRPVGDLVGRSGDTVTGITVTTGQSITAQPIAVLPPSSLSGTVYLDTNRDGLHESNEFGIAHVQVFLTGVNSLGQTVSYATTTDSNGVYNFTDLRPGTYALSRMPTPVFLPGSNNVGTVGGSLIGASIGRVALVGNESAQSYDFGARLKRGCILNTSALHAALLRGPHPTGPAAHLSKDQTKAGSLPLVRYWLPALSDQMGLISTNRPRLVSGKSKRS